MKQFDITPFVRADSVAAKLIARLEAKMRAEGHAASGENELSFDGQKRSFEWVGERRGTPARGAGETRREMVSTNVIQSAPAKPKPCRGEFV